MATGTLLLLLLLSLSLPASQAVHFELGIPDLIAIKHEKDGDVTVKGYRALTNEALLASNSSDATLRLLWATVGDPRIIKSAPPVVIGGGNASRRVFHFTDSGFYMMMQLKTAEDAELLAKRAALKYGLPVTPAQIRHLLLSKLSCVLDLRDSDRRSVRIVGAPTSLKNFPLKVEFPAPPGSEARSLFEKRLADDPDMSVPCSMCLSSVSEDTPPDQMGGANATNITESSVLPVPDSGGGGGPSDCRRLQPSAQSVAAELAQVAANLSGLACDVARLDSSAAPPALTAAIGRARAACARLSPLDAPQEGALANLTASLTARLAEAAGLHRRLLDAASALSLAAAAGGGGGGSGLQSRLALRAAYNLRSGRTHNLLDSRRLRVRPGPASNVTFGPDGARLRPSTSALLVVDDVGDDLADVLDLSSSGWTFFAQLMLDTDQASPQPLLTFWDPGSRLLWQLSVSGTQVRTALLTDTGSSRDLGGLASPAALRPGAWQRVGAAQAGLAAATHTVNGFPLAGGLRLSPGASSAGPAPPLGLPADRRQLWLGGGFSGSVACFGVAAAALTPGELEAVFAAYCD